MIERNDLCWCGSGKKYKKCHLFEDMKKNSSSLENKKKQKMIKTAEEIEGMRRAGAFNGQLMDYIRQFVKEGISTIKIDKLVYEYTLDHGHKPACLGYHGYPKSVCISRNNVVCHGIPSEREILEDGDIVNVDLTTIVDGFYGDSSETFLIGNVSSEVRRLVEVTAQAMIYGIDAVKPGNKLAAVAEAIEPYVKSEGFSVVRQYTGHGIGRKFHEIFTVYHHVDPDEEPIILEPGMTFTVEPMVNMGGYQVVTDRKDGWTVRTKDGSMSAQFEHTVLVTEEGREVLTRTPSQIAQNIRLEFSGKKFK